MSCSMANRRPNGVDLTRQLSRKMLATGKGSIKTVGGCDKSDQVDIVTREKYRNFELELEWRVAPGANSGIIYLIYKTGSDLEDRA